MSQIETIMLFALGFILAALIAMFLGRGLWNYGVKIGQRRMQKLSPLSITEVQADRDRLRAEYAVMTRKLELRLDDLKDRMAEQMAEVSRSKTRIEDLNNEIDERDQLLAEREAENATLMAKFEPLETELAARTASIQQLKEQLRNKSEQSENAQREMVQLRVQAEERDTLIKDLEAKLAGATHKAEVDKAITEKVAHLSKLAETIQEHKNNLNAQQEEIKSLESSLKDAEDKAGKPAVAKTTKHLSDSAGALEESMAEAENEAQKLHNELVEIDKALDGRSKKTAASKAAADEKPRKSATVTPLHKPDGSANTPAAKSDDKKDDSTEDSKKIAPESVAAKMIAASQASTGAKSDAKADAKSDAKDEKADPEVAKAEEEEVAAKNGTNGSSGTKVHKVLSLAQRIRALQNEITN